MFGSESNQLTYHPLPGSDFSLGCTWSLPLVLSASGRLTAGSEDHCPHAMEASIRHNNNVAAYTNLVFIEFSWAVGELKPAWKAGTAQCTTQRGSGQFLCDCGLCVNLSPALCRPLRMQVL